jgi:hypothetical protein
VQDSSQKPIKIQNLNPSAPKLPARSSQDLEDHRGSIKVSGKYDGWNEQGSLAKPAKTNAKTNLAAIKTGAQSANQHELLYDSDPWMQAPEPERLARNPYMLKPLTEDFMAQRNPYMSPLDDTPT